MMKQYYRISDVFNYLSNNINTINEETKQTFVINGQTITLLFKDVLVAMYRYSYRIFTIPDFFTGTKEDYVIFCYNNFMNVNRDSIEQMLKVRMAEYEILDNYNGIETATITHDNDVTNTNIGSNTQITTYGHKVNESSTSDITNNYDTTNKTTHDTTNTITGGSTNDSTTTTTFGKTETANGSEDTTLTFGKVESTNGSTNDTTTHKVSAYNEPEMVNDYADTTSKSDNNTITNSGSDKTNTINNNTITNSGSDSIAVKGSESNNTTNTMTGNDTITNTGNDTSNSSNTNEITNSGTDNTSFTTNNTNTNKDTGKIVEERTRHGNLGVTSSQTMLEQEIKLRSKWSFYDWLAISYLQYFTII